MNYQENDRLVDNRFIFGFKITASRIHLIHYCISALASALGMFDPFPFTNCNILRGFHQLKLVEVNCPVIVPSWAVRFTKGFFLSVIQLRVSNATRHQCIDLILMAERCLVYRLLKLVFRFSPPLVLFKYIA